MKKTRSKDVCRLRNKHTLAHEDAFTRAKKTSSNKLFLGCFASFQWKMEVTSSMPCKRALRIQWTTSCHVVSHKQLFALHYVHSLCPKLKQDLSDAKPATAVYMLCTLCQARLRLEELIILLKFRFHLVG